MDVMSLMTSFEGRINRAKWWLGLLILVILHGIAWGICAALFGLPVEPHDPNFVVFWIVFGILMLILIWPTLALYTKRWHDRGKSGWWTLIAFVPLIGGIWILIELGILEGTRGPNQYGPDPLGR